MARVDETEGAKPVNEDWDSQHQERVGLEPLEGKDTGSSVDQLDQNSDPASSEYRAAERKILRKLDFTLMPTIWLLYFFNYLDRNNIA